MIAATIYQRPPTQGRLALQAIYRYLLDGTCPPPRGSVTPHIVMRSNLKLFLERLPVDEHTTRRVAASSGEADPAQLLDNMGMTRPLS